MESVFKCRFDIQKTEPDKQLVFGWANISAGTDGEQLVDYQNDMIDIEELEKAAYDFVLNYGKAGEIHMRKNVGAIVESIVFTKEKTRLMGIPDGTVPEGWFVGFKIHDKPVWDKVKNGDYEMFSIEGTGTRSVVM